MNFNAKFETPAIEEKDSKARIIFASLAAIFLICGVLMAIFHPEAQFDWFFGQIQYFLGLFILAAICLISFLYQLGDRHEEKYYFTSDGKLDLSIPRRYKKLKRNKVFSLLGRKSNVEEFAYDGEGNVYIQFAKGEDLTAPLEDLTVSYSMDKNQATGDFYIHRMKITTPDGRTYKVKRGLDFEDAESDDIFMILSTARTLKESNIISKANKWVSKIKDTLDDFDFSNLTESVVQTASDVAHSAMGNRKTADNNVITFVKTAVYKDKQKKSWFKKIMDYFWTIVAIVYVIAVLIVNIAALPEIFGSKDNDTEDFEYLENVDDTENSEDIAGYYSDNDQEIYPAEGESEYTEGDDPMDASGLYWGNGTVDGKYPVRIQLQLTDGDATNYYVTGKYAYESTLEKYGEGDASWFPIRGKLDEINGILTFTTYKVGSSEPFEQFRADVSDYYSGSIDATGPLTNVNTGNEHSMSFKSHYKN